MEHLRFQIRICSLTLTGLTGTNVGTVADATKLSQSRPKAMLQFLNMEIQC